MIKGFILCDKGFEEIVAEDTARLLGKDISPKITERGFYFQTKDLKDFLTLAYQSQSILRLVVPMISLKRDKSIGELATDTESMGQHIIDKLDMSKFDSWLGEDQSFKVEVSDITKQYDSQKLAKTLGAHIFTQTNTPADMKTPKTKLLFLATENDIMFGIDFSYTILSKREYKMFNIPTALRATIAYNLLCHSGVIDDMCDIPDDEELTVIDPFAGSGSIPIEAALFAQNISPRFFELEDLGFWKYKPFTQEEIKNHIESLQQKRGPKQNISVMGFDIQTKAVDSIKKNAKIAGVNKYIRFSRAEIDWIDTKFQKDEIVDYVVTVPPYFTQHQPIEKTQKIYHQFFKRISDVLDIDGNITLLTNNAAAVKETIPEEFVLEEETTVWMGNDAYSLLVIEYSEEAVERAEKEAQEQDENDKPNSTSEKTQKP